MADRVEKAPAEPGQRLGNYEVLAEIGRGGMGVVYRARDLRLGRDVALKAPWAPPGASARVNRQLMREARAASRLSHPNIVPVFDVFEHEGRPWLVMELVPGTSLRGLLLHRRPLPLEEILKYGEGLAAALAAAHERHIVHRDVKPSNVLITRDGRAMLTDFGLAQLVRVSADSPTQSRDSDAPGRGKLAGTVHYMSPEQALGRSLDSRSDIFALGAVIYEMCTGAQAFPDTSGEALDSLLHHEPAAISKLNYEVPEELERIVRKSLAKEPTARYQDPNHLLADLQALRRDVEHRRYASVTSPIPRRRSWRARHAVLATGAALVAAGLVVRWVSKPPARVTTMEARPRLAVLPYRDLTAEGKASDWPDLIQSLFVRELTGVEGLGVVDPITLGGILESRLGSAQPRRGQELLNTLHAAAMTFVVDGTIAGKGGAYRLHTSLVQPETNEVRLADDTMVQGEGELPQAMATVAARIVTFLELNTASRDKSLNPYLSVRPRNLEAEKAFLQATQYSLRSEPGAEAYLRRAVELEPQFIAARVWLVSSLRMSRQTELAREQYRILEEQESRGNAFEQSLIRWAGALLADDPAAQARHIQVSLRYSPDNNILLVTLAEAKLAMDDFEGALTAIGPPLAVNWRYPDVYVIQGISLLGLERLPEAEAALGKATAIQPVAAEIYGMLAALARKRAAVAEAEGYEARYFVRSREIGKAEGRAQEDLAGHLMRVGLFAPAGAAMRRAMADLPDRPTIWTDLLYRSRGSEGATTAVAGTSPDEYLLQGRILEQRGRIDEAISRYRAFLNIEKSGREADAVRRHISIRLGPKAQSTRRSVAR